VSLDIRAVRADDRDAWLRLRRLLWPEGGEEHAAEIDGFFEDSTSVPHGVVVAEEDGWVVGFAELSIRPFAEGCVTDRVGYLEGWFVDERYRRRGIGRALVTAAEAWARERGCVEFASDARATNRTSVRAHMACGFEDVGTVRCFRKRIGAD